MKPIKNLEPLAKWTIRFASMAFIISLYFSYLKTFDFKSIAYILDFIYCLFFVLLFIGGFQKNNVLTIISGLFIAAISIYKTYVAFNGNFLDTELYRWLIMLGIGLFFASKGNS